MSEKSDVVLILSTAPDPSVAERVARALLEQRLVACANVLPGVRSHYWWKDEIETSTEALTLMKARWSDVERIVARLREMHPYEVPEVIAVPVVAGLDSYLDWVIEETDRRGG